MLKLNEQLNFFLKNKVSSMPAERVYYEDKSDKQSLKQLQHLFDYDPFFHKMMFGSKFERFARILLDDTVVGKNMQYFNKPPGLNKATPPHQDGYYFMLEPSEAVTMWLALERVNKENGCVRYVRGSHKEGMRSHGRTQVLGFSQGILDFGNEEDLSNAVHHLLEAGDLLAHHSLTIHWADRNSSFDRSRKSLGFIYYAQKAREDTKAHLDYQRKLEAELDRKSMI